MTLQLQGLRRCPGAAVLTSWSVLALAVGACRQVDRPAEDGWDGAEDTLAGGRVVVRNGGRPLWGAGGGWRLEEVDRIGRLQGEGPDALGEIRAVEVDGQGRVYVLDSRAREIRVFDSGGRYLRSLGRPGEGPGELAAPAGLAWGPAGGLWVMDFGNGRYTAFDPESGEVLEERRRPMGFAVIPWPGGFDREGGLLDTGLGRVEGSPGIPSLIRLDTAFLPVDTLPLPRADDRDRILFTRPDGTPVMSMMDPFTPGPVWSIWPGGGLVAVRGVDFRLDYVHFGPDTVRTVELDRPRAPVSGRERDSVLVAFRETARQVGGSAEPDREPRVPDLKPAVRSVFQDDRDHLWVRPWAASGAPPTYDIFDPRGRYLGAVELPVAPAPAVRPVVRGDRMVVATAGALGTPIVVVLRIGGR